jgi:VWFA-related protein
MIFVRGDLLLNGCSLFRQYGSIEGYVYVPDTGDKGAIIIRDSNQTPTGYKPLPGAKVSVRDFYKFVFTDINGYFLLEEIMTGLANLLIEPPIDSGYNDLTTQVIVEPDTTVPIGTYGAVSLPSEGAGYWDIIINQIDDSEYPEVKVYVSVIDPGNDIPIVGATSDNFELDINGNKINTFTVTQAPGEISYPASVSLVIDRSGSMEGEYGDDQPLEDAKAGAKTFVNLMGSIDRAEIISFGDDATVDQSFTSDKQVLYNAIDSLYSDGATALYDAIWLGLYDTAKETNSRKAVIALTDGGENNSSSDHGGGDYNFSDGSWSEYPDNSLLINYANSLNIPVYTIGLQGFNFTREKITRSYTTTEADLKEIGITTGGGYFYAPSSDKLEKIYEEITQRLEQQYIIAFTDNTGITEGYLTVKLYYNQLYGEDTKEYNPPEKKLSAAGLAKNVIGANYLWGGKGFCYTKMKFLEPEEIFEEYTYWNGSALDRGSGLDCSGLIFWSYNKSYGATEFSGDDNPVKYQGANPQYWYNFEESISEENLKPGDLLFFDYNSDDRMDHVAMYVGSDVSSYDVVEAYDYDRGIIWSKKEELMSRNGFVGFRRITKPRIGIEFRTTSPVDLIITDPDGLTITKDIYEIPGAFYYYVSDIDGNGELDDIILAPEKKIGNYLLSVIPEKSARANDTYSIEIVVDSEVFFLAKDIQISDIPDQPIVIRSSENSMKLIEKP